MKNYIGQIGGVDVNTKASILDGLIEEFKSSNEFAKEHIKVIDESLAKLSKSEPDEFTSRIDELNPGCFSNDNFINKLKNQLYELRTNNEKLEILSKEFNRLI